MLLNSFLLAAFATIACTAPLYARDDDTQCTRAGYRLWHLKQNADALNVGDLTSHPVWDKKFDTVCECANAVRNTAVPQAPVFVWNSETKGCYPKGIRHVDDKGCDTSVTLLIADMEVWPSDQPNYTYGNTSFGTKECSKLRLPRDFASDSCAGLVLNNRQWDFATQIIDRTGRYYCQLCNWDKADRMVLGHQVFIY